MAVNLKISGNLFILTDVDSGEQQFNQPRSNTRYFKTSAVDSVFYEFLTISVTGKTNPTNKSNKILFSDIIDDRTGLVFESASELEDYLGINIGGFFLNELELDFDISEAIKEVKSTYGDDISILKKSKSLTKFGRNKNVSNSELTTIMTLPSGELNETYVSTNIIDTISSDNASDTEEITIEGHTIDGSGDFTFFTQSVTLNGQNKVVLGTPLARMTRMFNNNGVELVGTIYGYEDTAISGGVPIDGTKVHCMIAEGRQQSQKASTTISKDDYWILTEFYADVLEKTSAFAEIDLEVRFKDKVFRQRIEIAASSSGRAEHDFKPFFIIPPNSDVRIRSLASNSNTDISAGIQGYLAKKI